MPWLVANAADSGAGVVLHLGIVRNDSRYQQLLNYYAPLTAADTRPVRAKVGRTPNYSCLELFAVYENTVQRSLPALSLTECV